MLRTIFYVIYKADSKRKTAAVHYDDDGPAREPSPPVRYQILPVHTRFLFFQYA